MGLGLGTLIALIALFVSLDTTRDRSAPPPSPADNGADPALTDRGPTVLTSLDPPKRTPVADLKPGDSFWDCPECPEMVVIRAGKFMMGSPPKEEGRAQDEGPQRAVTIKAFAMAKTEATFSHWDACVEDGGCQSNKRPEDWEWGRGNRPVITVSWHDAQEYVAWLNSKVEGNLDPYRLPSEAEWEYAARARTTTAFPWGDDWDGSKANGAGSVGKTTEVGSYPANGFGLRDMHGNVWEWVEDCWHDTYKDAPIDGTAWLSSQNGNCDRRVVRGGSWGNSPPYLRSAVRSRVVPELRSNSIAFRPARTLLTP